jgi:hypothetical protein
MHLFSRLSTLLLGACVVAPALAQTTIQSVSYTGTGCPSGSVGVAIAANAKTMTLIFDKYVAQSGPGVSASENAKNCDVSVALHFSKGVQITLTSADYRGYAQLTAGSVGVGVAYYRWTPNGPVVRSNMIFFC